MFKLLQSWACSGPAIIPFLNADWFSVSYTAPSDPLTTVLHCSTHDTDQLALQRNC